MAKIFIPALTFGVALQLFAFLSWAFNIFGGLAEYPLGDVSSVTGVFDISLFSVLLGIGGAIGIGLAGLLLKQNTYAIMGMLLWGIGCMFNIVQKFFLVIPNTLGLMLPAETNPNPGLFSINPIVMAVGGIFAFIAWLYIFGLVIQREIR